MSPFQEAVRDRFYRHVCEVPPSAGRVVEVHGPAVSGYDEVGYDMYLALEPVVPEQCPLSISLADVLGQVRLGEALLDYYPYGRWGRSDGSEWVDLIEQDVICAVNGRVKDFCWLRRGRPVHAVTYACGESGDWRAIHTRGFPFMTRVVELLSRFYERSETVYKPYLAPEDQLQLNTEN